MDLFIIKVQSYHKMSYLHCNLINNQSMVSSKIQLVTYLALNILYILSLHHLHPLFLHKVYLTLYY